MTQADRTRAALALPLALMLMIGWSASLYVALFKGEYTPLTLVTPGLLLLAGYVFGTSIVKRVIKDVGEVE